MLDNYILSSVLPYLQVYYIISSGTRYTQKTLKMAKLFLPGLHKLWCPTHTSHKKLTPPKIAWYIDRIGRFE